MADTPAFEIHDFHDYHMAQQLAAVGPFGYTLSDEDAPGPAEGQTVFTASVEQKTSVFRDVRRKEMDKGNVQKRNVLSFDGGGIRGFLSISLFEEYCKQLWQREKNLPEQNVGPVPESVDDFAQRFIEDKINLITGTSIGGIIALMLAMKTPVSKVKELFEDKKDVIFKKQNIFVRLYDSKYTSSGLKEVAEELVKDAQKRGALHRNDIDVSEVRMSDLTLPCAVCSYDVRSSQVIVFHNILEARMSKDERTKAMKMNSIIYSPDANIIDVALATSAAPTYFPIHEFEIDKEGSKHPTEFQCIDGGVWANDPRVAAMSLLTAAWKNSLQDNEPELLQKEGTPRLLFCMQAFGTGTAAESELKGGGGNTLSWLTSSPNVVDIILNASENQVVSVVQSLHQAGLVYYNKIQIVLDPYISLDDTKSLPKQAELARKFAEDPNNWKAANALAIGMGFKGNTDEQETNMCEMMKKQECYYQHCARKCQLE